MEQIFSTKERIKILKEVIFKTDYLSVNNVAAQLNLSKGLVSKYFDILENDIRFLHKNKKELDIHAKTLNEQIINLQDYTNKNSEEIAENKRITGLARKNKNMERVAANMRQYENLKMCSFQLS